MLAIEIESPRNPRYDYQTKRKLYLDAEVPEYWVASPHARTIARWRRPEDPGEILSQQIAWQAPGMTSPLLIDLPSFLSEALGDA